MLFKKEEKKVKDNEEPEVSYAYIVFKNMDGKDLVLKAYNSITWKEKFALKYDCIQRLYFKNNEERLQKL